MSVQVSYKKQTIFGILLICIIVLVLEVISIIILDEKNSCYLGLTESGIYQDSNVDLKKLCEDYKTTISYHNPAKHNLPNQYSDTVNINSMGFRGDEIEKNNNNKQYRIFFLGGSTAYGVYSTSDKTTISGYLQQKFTNSNVEIINAGVNGANSFDETYTIKQKLMNLSPNLFIVYDGWNDLSNPIRTEYPEKNFQDDINLNILKIKKYYKTIDFLEFSNRVLTKQVYGDRGSPGESHSNTNIDEKIKLWKNRWSEVCSIANEQNIKTIIIIQPLLGAGNKNLNEWEKYMSQQYSHASVISNYENFKTTAFELEKQCSLVVDLTNVFDTKTELIYYDLGHMGDNGNKIVSEKIYDEILPIILKDISN